MVDEHVDSEDDFVAVAIAHGLLKEDHAAKVRDHARSNSIQPSDSALTLSILQANEVEAIHLLSDPNGLAPGYELTGLIGCGAGGMVFRARQTALDREVALKTINPRSRTAQTTGEPRIQREAHAIAKLRHPGIVAAFDSGFFQGRFCIAMELVEGENLVDFIQRRSHIPEQVVWQMTRQVACALLHACDAGIIHRDIKPANLLLCDPPKGMDLPPGVPFVKVADFGLATDDQSTNQITATGATLGTPAYVAPEQLQDPKVDARADIYSLGATVFHMLSSHPPCIGQSPMKPIMQKTIGDDRWRDEISPTVSPDSILLFREMTEADPEQRIANHETLIERIDHLLANLSTETSQSNRPIVNPNVRPTGKPASAVGTSEGTLDLPDRTLVNSSSNIVPRKRSRVFALAITLSLLAIAGLAGIAMFAGSQGLDDDRQPADTEETTLQWSPNGFPQPLFNGSSVPPFLQAGVWLPVSASDGSRVLAGEAGSWMTIPMSTDNKQGRDVRLRVGVNLAIDSETLIEIGLANSKSSELATLRFVDGLVHFVPPGSDTKSEVSRSLASTGSADDKAVFRRLAFIRHGAEIHAILNGETLGRVPCEPSADASITLRCIRGTTNFADIDIVGGK